MVLPRSSAGAGAGVESRDLGQEPHLEKHAFPGWHPATWPSACDASVHTLPSPSYLFSQSRFTLCHLLWLQTRAGCPSCWVLQQSGISPSRIKVPPPLRRRYLLLSTHGSHRAARGQGRCCVCVIFPGPGREVLRGDFSEGRDPKNGTRTEGTPWTQGRT